MSAQHREATCELENNARATRQHREFARASMQLSLVAIIVMWKHASIDHIAAMRSLVVVASLLACCAVATKAGGLHCPAHGASCDQIWCVSSTFSRSQRFCRLGGIHSCACRSALRFALRYLGFNEVISGPSMARRTPLQQGLAFSCVSTKIETPPHGGVSIRPSISTPRASPRFFSRAVWSPRSPGVT